MTTNAKLYVTALLVLGLCVLTMNFADWHLADPVRFLAFFFFACAASIMKVAAPAMAGKMSFNFIFVLIALTDLTLPEALLIGCASVVIECVWRPNSRTTPLEVFFSIANMAVAIACANAVMRYPLQDAADRVPNSPGYGGILRCQHFPMAGSGRSQHPRRSAADMERK